MAPAASEFFTQGRTGHAVPMAPGHSGYSQRDPWSPSPLRGTNALLPSCLNSAWGYQAAGINFPEASILLSIPHNPEQVKETGGEGGMGRSDVFCREGLKS